MMHRAVLFVLVCTAPFAQAGSSSNQAETNPVEKVIEMLSDLQQKIIREGEAAQKLYDEFAEWCEEESKNLGFAIKTGKSQVEELTATIEKATSDIAAQDEEIAKLAATIATDEADLKAANAIREKEHNIFIEEEADLVDTVDTLERAVSILERELSKGSASFTQIKNAKNVASALQVLLQANTISSEDSKKLTALLQSQHESQSDDGDEELGAPDPATYKHKAGGIVDVLNDLLEKAQAQLAEARKTESDSQHNFDVLKLELDDAIAFANKCLDKAKKAKAAAAETKAAAEGDLAVTSKALAEDIAQLADTHHQCMEKATDFENETKSRGEELKALAEAKKVIIEATGGAAEQTYSLAQTSDSFLQISSGARLRTKADLANFEAIKP